MFRKSDASPRASPQRSTMPFRLSLRLLALLAAAALLAVGTACDSGPQPPEETCTPTASTNGPVGEWEFLGLGGDDITSITAIAVHPCDPEVIFAGSNFNFSDDIQGVLFKTENGGETWDTLLVGGSYSEIIIERSDPDVVYVAHTGAAGRTGAGVLKSTNGGATWRAVNEGLELQGRPSTGAYTLAMRPDQPEVLYASTASPQLGGWFYRSTSGGEQWERVEWTETSKLLANGVTNITFDSANPATMYVGTGVSGHLLQSTDGGGSWQITGWNPPEQPRGERYGSVRDLYIMPETGTMYAATSLGYTSHGAYRSRDGGTTWEPFTEALPDSVTGQALAGNPEEHTLYLLVTKAGHRRQPNDEPEDLRGIFRLDRSAERWRRMPALQVGQLSSTSTIVYSSADQALYVSAEGIHRMKLDE